ncbi:Uncharacterized protein BM_BM17297 [Brugia malayi]|uniref:Uncharacterized protein n=1 Tax=Brugia malayi TaxID=6279 RepID=A0A4E9FUL1_BRUMA|nr:Uncharacterized protein BM_BM17297 [Brugia malayi]VIP00505.1 Uncharacterized protein BM_BM17297 [Brugia malayi]
MALDAVQRAHYAELKILMKNSVVGMLYSAKCLENSQLDDEDVFIAGRQRKSVHR